MDFTIPGTLGPLLAAKRNLLGNVQIYADGVKLPRHGWFRSWWSVVASDGRTYELRLGRSLTTTKIRVSGHELTVERPLARWEIALVVLPIGLAAVGGIIGALFGAAAAELNRRVARSELRSPSRAVAMLGVTLAAAALWFGTTVGLAIIVAPVPEYVAGTCYQGFDEGAGFEGETMTSVDCSVLHDAEVVANVEAPDEPYPGTDALEEYADGACRKSFEAYVGAPYKDSVLSLVYAYPDDLLWLKGDRTIDCFVFLPDSGQLDHSVRQTGM